MWYTTNRAPLTKIVKKSLKFTSVLGLMFILLKLTNFIDWSWFWVLFPFYGGFLIIFSIIALAFIGGSLFAISIGLYDRFKNN